MRVLSLNFRQALFAQQSGEVALLLLTITHPSLATPIRLTTDPTVRLTTDPLLYGTTSRGHDYLFVGMEVALPEEQDKSPPSSKLVISNVDRSIIPLIRSINSPAQVQMEGLLVSDLSTVEFTVPALDIVNVTYDAGQITADLMMDVFASEPYPAGNFDPASFPGIFVA